MLPVPSVGARRRVCQRHTLAVGVGRCSHDAVERATLRQGAERCTTVFERARCRALRNYMSSLPPRFSRGARGARSCVAIVPVTQTNATKRLRRCHVSNSGKLVLVAHSEETPAGNDFDRALPEVALLWETLATVLLSYPRGSSEARCFCNIRGGELGAMSTPPPRP